MLLVARLLRSFTLLFSACCTLLTTALNKAPVHLCYRATCLRSRTRMTAARHQMGTFTHCADCCKPHRYRYNIAKGTHCV